MNARLLAGAALLALVAGGVSAETRPRPLATDARIRTFDYHEHEVYRVDLFMRFITSIEFAEGESIESIAFGDSASWYWERLNRGNVLMIKPTIPHAATNMVVHTDRRAYAFDLRARQARMGSKNINYRIAFRYPEEEAREAARRTEVATRPRDYDYRVSGEAGFEPVRVYDDEVRTVFDLPPNARRPAVFRVDPMGRETVVNVRHTVEGIVVDSVSDRWTLRIGDVELCVFHADVVDTIRGADADEAPNFPGGSDR